MSYFNAWIECAAEDGEYLGKCQTAATRTLADAIADGVRGGTFYLLSAGYVGVRFTVEEFCDYCHGIGTVVTRGPETRIRTNRPTKRVRCTKCAGHAGPLSTLGPISVECAVDDRHKACGNATNAVA